MVIVIKGVLGGADLSPYLDRGGNFQVNSVVGSRIDTLHMTFFDPDLELHIPPRSEVIVYDFDPSLLPDDWVWAPTGVGSSPAPIIDPVNGDMAIIPTPRLFAGFTARPDYYLSAHQRYIGIDAQDYTCRLKMTVINKGYDNDTYYDDQIVRDLFNTYRPEVDTSAVVQVFPDKLPLLRMPTHTLEQAMARIAKLTRATYRVDYYNRLRYSTANATRAPFDISDTPNYDLGGSPTGSIVGGGGYMAEPDPSVAPDYPSIGCEQLHYAPDDSQGFDRCWVVGAKFRGDLQDFQIKVIGDGTVFSFPLPANVADVTAASTTFKLNGVDQGRVGVLGKDGQITDDAPTRAAWGFNALVGINPPTLALKTAPAPGDILTLHAQFLYPLVSIVSNATVQASYGGLIFEKVIRDTRIDDINLAHNVGVSAIAQQGAARKGGSCIIRTKGIDGDLLEVGDLIYIKNVLFAGLLPGGVTTLLALVNRLTVTLDDDIEQPYKIAMEFADQTDLQSTDITDLFMTEQARINAALSQTSMDDIVTDFQELTDDITFSETLTATTLTGDRYGSTVYGTGHYA